MPVMHTVQVGSMEIGRRYWLPEELRIWQTLQAYFSKEFSKQAKMGIPSKELWDFFFIIIFYFFFSSLEPYLFCFSDYVILRWCMVNCDDITIILHFTD